MKIYCIIQARFGSTRLPGKVLATLSNDPSDHVLRAVCERCSCAELVSALIVIWYGTPEPPLWLGKIRVIPCEHEEPAARFLGFLHKNSCDGFVRVCADSPFIDSEIIDEAAQAIIDGKDYFLAGKGLMHGNQAEGFNTQAFLKAEPNMQGDEREHLGLWFQRRDRLTVDTPADLERARLIVSRMTKPHTEYTAAECLELLRDGN